MSATREDCPCCFEDGLTPGEDTDRALIVAFVSGMHARDCGVTVSTAMCAKHAALAMECIAYARAEEPSALRGAS